ncbi:16S rRNA processing protein RimM [Berryella wangjianweii]|uniref:16S rRNA processing protein RimM n=1 Tax=Berryella wangjianweii TaxID=2734634 RepID=A0A6M8J282_9ACTN|nr:PRC-barrel domain-containing protein [Berryella wangjianweii]NPD32438.1 16S rRNA processing protein RimM [Eggerthellaceae bacterium zg-997]QKF06803.1 16S rRNA processing protein RimM [Berryella wangjianweii]
MRTWTNVAVLAKARSRAGGFVAKSAAGLPFLLAEGMEVAFVPPRLDAPRRARVERVWNERERSAQVSFEGIDDPSVAADLVGCQCLVRTADLDLDRLRDDPVSWSGWEVVDVVYGPLGRVSDVIENPGQTLVEVDAPGRDRPLLIPAVDAFIRAVDVEAGRIEVSVPEGLLHL